MDYKLLCLDLPSGKQLWERNYLYVLHAGDQFELPHTNELAGDDMCMATPAIVEDRQLIRTPMRGYCVRPSEPVVQNHERRPSAETARRAWQRREPQERSAVVERQS